jgi:hypothetical protein
MVNSPHEIFVAHGTEKIGEPTDEIPRLALVRAGVIPEPKEGERHQAAREHGMHALRHLDASV